MCKRMITAHSSFSPSLVNLQNLLVSSMEHREVTHVVIHTWAGSKVRTRGTVDWAAIQQILTRWYSLKRSDQAVYLVRSSLIPQIL